MQNPYIPDGVHCDLAPRNIIVNDGIIAGIIDWEMAGWLPEYWEYFQVYFSNFHRVPEFGELFKEVTAGTQEAYPDELIAELCLASVFICA